MYEPPEQFEPPYDPDDDPGEPLSRGEAWFVYGVSVVMLLWLCVVLYVAVKGLRHVLHS